MPTTRRRFLMSSALAASAAVGFPTFVPRSVLGDAKQAPANSRLGLGYIGLGIQARGHLGWGANHGDCEVRAICEVDKTRREDAGAGVAERLKKLNRPNPRTPDLLTDYQELLARKDIDAVVIATPDHWHALMIAHAAIAGKHIYCEKPLTLNIHEAKFCVDIVRKHKVTFQTGSQQRNEFRGWFRKAAAYVRGGRIGKVTEVTVGVGGPSKWCDLPEELMEPGLDWDRWLGPAPKRAYHSVLSPRGLHKHFPAWRAYREYSGGGLTDIGAHHFDIAQWGLGMDGSGPVEIIPPADPKSGKGCKLIYANGVVMTHGGPGGIVFKGDKGTIHVDRSFIKSDPESILLQPLTDHDEEAFKPRGHKDNWFECIKTGQSPEADVHIGAGTVTVCHLTNLAYWHGRKLHWDPKAWQFTDGKGGLDAEANGWRDYERRGTHQLPKL